MKIRNGFVSNSSSSSFIIRGTKINKDELIKALDIDVEKLSNDQDGTKYYSLLRQITTKMKSLNLHIEDARTEWDKLTNECIVGEHFGYIEDGDIIEIEGNDDEEIISKIRSVGLKVEGLLKTYIQYKSEG